MVPFWNYFDVGLCAMSGTITSSESYRSCFHERMVDKAGIKRMLINTKLIARFRITSTGLKCDVTIPKTIATAKTNESNESKMAAQRLDISAPIPIIKTPPATPSTAGTELIPCSFGCPSTIRQITATAEMTAKTPQSLTSMASILFGLAFMFVTRPIIKYDYCLHQL